MQAGLRQLTFDLLSRDTPCAGIHALAQRHCRLVPCEGRNMLTSMQRSVEQFGSPEPAVMYDIAQTQRAQARCIAEGLAGVLIVRHGWRSAKTLTHKQIGEVADAIEELLEYWRAMH